VKGCGARQGRVPFLKSRAGQSKAASPDPGNPSRSPFELMS
jgi:hypothetical protein